MYQYLVKYWTTDARQVGMIVMADSFADAEAQARAMSNFSHIANLPERVG